MLYDTHFIISMYLMYWIDLMYIIYFIHFMYCIYFIDLITQQQAPAAPNNTRGAPPLAAPPLCYFLLCVIRSME